MKHIPNILSVLRILMIPLFVWQIATGQGFNAAIILAVSGLTDLLDGFLARRFGWVSQVGKVLDPAADKLTQVSVYIALVIKLRKMWPFFMVLMLKEAVMLIFGGRLLVKGVKLEGARWFGKVTTIVFYVSMTAIILFPALPQSVIYALLTLTSVCSVTSALMYIPDYKRYLKETKK